MSFLSHVANTYYSRFGNRISELTFVFPNRRAGVFFRSCLCAEIESPVFAPRILTVEQLFEQFSSLQAVDPTELLFRLYEVYREVHLLPNNEDESFDNFVFWGRMMLSDFNDVDMHLADAGRLFANLRDIKDIELLFADGGEEQRELYRQFVASFSAVDAGKYHNRFMHIWRSMFAIYTALRDNLRRDGMAYEGMLCRDVVETLQNRQAEGVLSAAERMYVFVGFNALSGVERSLMSLLQQAGMAEFCWDYFSPFLSDAGNRASLFMADNLRMFPNSIQADDARSARFPELTLVEVPSSTGEASVVGSILSRIAAEEPSPDWTETGIVLPDEHLLSAVRLSVPPEVDSLNITMGQALSETPVMSLLQHLSELQLLSKPVSQAETLFYYKPVLALLAHPYVACLLSEEDKSLRLSMQKANMTYVSQEFFETSGAVLKKIFVRYSDAQQTVDGLHDILRSLVTVDEGCSSEKNEYLYQTMLQVRKVGRLLQAYPDIVLNVKTLYSLLLALVSGVRVPFEGEPLSGLQIMGVLESRSMSFRNLIITDVNEDTFPGSNRQQTYIPYDLRRAYGLPTQERQDAVFAYNFYRLVSGSERVWLLQNTTANDMRSGEPSRYVYQLENQYGILARRIGVPMLPSVNRSNLPTVSKDDWVIRELKETLCPADDNIHGKGLSPSALNTYVECPLKFYLTYIKHLRESDKIQEQPGANQFGDVLHRTMQDLYSPFSGGKQVVKSDIESMRNRVLNTSLVGDNYRSVFLKTSSAPFEGKDMLVIHVLKQYALHVLDYDLSLAPFRYLASELECRARVDVPAVGSVYLHGLLDRVDIVDGCCRVVDYKTGESKSKLDCIENLFLAGPDADHVRQTLIYCLLLTGKTAKGGKLDYPDNADIVPHIYYVRQSGSQIDLQIGLSKEPMSGYASVRGEFNEALQQVLAEIFNQDVPFFGKPHKNCEYCPFLSICGV
ncbi:MAG: PD-(D/E)XK nuclease family protein [Paludibacteraceae bacterium]|nr:PD-(D/E)XK nuclease family protein [Paludibacteraceae bacterium]